MNTQADTISQPEIFPSRHIIFIIAFFCLYTLSLFIAVVKNTSWTFSGIDSHWFFPYKVYWIESLKRGDPAFWNPFLGLGNPFVANNTLGAFSPANILFFFFSPALAFTASAYFYFVLAAVGTCLFMRKLGCEWQGSLLAGLGYTFSIFTYVQLRWGHHCMVGLEAGLPWALYFLHRALEEKRLWLLGMVSACLTVAFYIGGYPQMVLYTFMMLGLYLIYAWLRRIVSLKQMLLAGTLMVVVFSVLSACQLFSTLVLAPLCLRGDWTYGTIMKGFSRMEDFRHFIWPAWGYWKEIERDGPWARIPFNTSIHYVGIVVLVLFFAGIFHLRKLAHYGFFLFSSIIFILLAMGDSTTLTRGLFRFFYDYLPFFDKFRYIHRIIFLTCFAMACGAGLVLSAAIKSLAQKGPGFRRWGLFLVRFALVFMALDMWLWGKTSLTVGPFQKSPPLPPRIWEIVMADKSYPRIRPEYPHNQNLFFKVGQHPILDTKVLKLLALPDPLDAPLADLINLKYVRFTKWTPSERWKEVGEKGHYMNTKTLPRAFLAGGYQLTDGHWERTIQLINSGTLDLRSLVLLETKPEISFAPEPGIAGDAEITAYRNNNVDIQCNATRPCFLFLSDPFYPYWEAWVDGTKTPLYQADGSFRAVAIEVAGNHKIEMKYIPIPLYAGMVVSFLGWLVLGWLIWKKRNMLLFGPFLFK